MKIPAIFFASLIILTGCSIIENIEIMSDHIDDTTNPNALSYGRYSNFLHSINEETPENIIKIEDLRNKRKIAANKTWIALCAQGYSNDEKNKNVNQQEFANQKNIEAYKSVEEYLKSAVKYNKNKWKSSAKKALKTLDQASNYQQLKKFKDAENKLKLALLILVNNRTALWLYQKKEKHIFPEYLKWGSSGIIEKKSVIHSPDSLVFSGGGARGPAYAGVLKYLQEKDKLKNVKRFIGTSAGSIMCTFMSIATYYENNKKNRRQACLGNSI